MKNFAPFKVLSSLIPFLSTLRLYRNMKKTLWKRREAVGWKRFRAVTLVVRIQTRQGYEHVQFYISEDFP